MNSYKRIVSYMYQYQMEEKQENVGYAKIEQRGEKCRIFVQVRTDCANKRQRIYLFSKKTNGIEAIPMGVMTEINGGMCFKATTETNNLFRSGKALEEADGIFIYEENSKYFATIWSNETFRIGEWQRQQTREQEDTNVTKDLNEKPHIFSKEHLDSSKETEMELDGNRQRMNINMERFETKKAEIEAENAETREAQSEVENAETREAQSEVENAETKEAQSEVENVEIKRAQSDTDRVEMKKVEMDTESAELETLETKMSQETKESSEQMQKEPKRQSMCHVCPFKERGMDYGRRILDSYPAMMPFGREDIVNCVRIELQDIGCLPMRWWYLAGNRFVLQGYYGYRHLIFAQRSSGTYLFGVPGIYNRTNKHCGRGNGFCDFCSLEERELSEGAFGYWLLELPDVSR